MAVETTYTGYIVVQFRDETTRKYEVEMPETGLEGMKTRIANLNANIESTPNNAFATTFISSAEDTASFDDRRAQKIIEAGANVIVAGSAVFKSDDPAEAVNLLKGI